MEREVLWGAICLYYMNEILLQAQVVLNIEMHERMTWLRIEYEDCSITIYHMSIISNIKIIAAGNNGHLMNMMSRIAYYTN